MGISSSRPSQIKIRPPSIATTSSGGDDAEAEASAPAAEGEGGEGEGGEGEDEESLPVILLRTRWVRDRKTNAHWIERNRRRDDMLLRRGEVTHVLRKQGTRFLTRHKDGTMQMDPQRRSLVEDEVAEEEEPTPDGAAA